MKAIIIAVLLAATISALAGERIIINRDPGANGKSRTAWKCDECGAIADSRDAIAHAVNCSALRAKAKLGDAFKNALVVLRSWSVTNTVASFSTINRDTLTASTKQEPCCVQEFKDVGTADGTYLFTVFKQLAPCRKAVPTSVMTAHPKHGLFIRDEEAK